MFTRQKFLLAYLLASGGRCEKIQLMKGLFYLCQESDKNLYDFHPYRYGPYSLVVDLDCKTLSSKNLIAIDGKNIQVNFELADKQKIIADIGSESWCKLSEISSRINRLDFEKLLDELYKSYPYFAINNEKKNKPFKCSDPRLDPNKQTAKIFTVGYEGVSIDQFFNNLIRNNVTTLVDVRNNPRSMKYGFTESTLRKLCTDRNIGYISVKNLGIPSEFRQELHTQKDYDDLFAQFEKKHIPKTGPDLQKLKELLDQGKRIALLCFEKDIHQCHRAVVAKHLYIYCKKNYELEHILTA